MAALWIYILCVFHCSVGAMVKKRERNMLEQRIIRGRRARPEDWPFIVHLNFLQPNPPWKTCGGAIIGDVHVLTAAHCVEDIYAHPHFLTVGVHRLYWSSDADPARNISVRFIILHPHFAVANNRKGQHNSLLNDIAILILRRPVRSFGIPVPLPLMTEDISSKVGVQCRAAGWGTLSEFPNFHAQVNDLYELSMELMEMDVALVNKQQCIQEDGLEGNPLFGAGLPHLICGGRIGMEQVSNPCVGDSGSPMTCLNENGQHVLQGIIIAGTHLCRPGISHFYLTEVSKFRQWIDHVLRKYVVVWYNPG